MRTKRQLTDTKHDLTANEAWRRPGSTTEVDEQAESDGKEADTEEDENFQAADAVDHQAEKGAGDDGGEAAREKRLAFRPLQHRINV